jgi:predicted nuclease with TOPRIM domain
MDPVESAQIAELKERIEALEVENARLEERLRETVLTLEAMLNNIKRAVG